MDGSLLLLIRFRDVLDCRLFLDNSTVRDMHVLSKELC